MTSKLLIACASFALLAGCNQAGPVDQSNDNAKTQIATVFANWQKAFEAKDVNGVMVMYAPDVTAFDIVPPLQFKGADAYRKDYVAFFGQFDGPIRVDVPNMQVETGGDVALAYGLERITGKMKDGTPVDMWLRYTEGLKRIGGQWRVVHEHISVPVDMGTGKAVMDLKP
jgi:uncharacterized protein (TIGR02246 family)